MSEMSVNSENNLGALWKAILHNQKQVWLTMHSGSMSPLMPTGSQIFVKSLEHAHQKISAGDIVLYINDNQLIAHRVLWLRCSQHQCLEGGDSAVSTSFISIDNIIGVVEKIKVNDKEFDLNSRAGVLLIWFITATSLGILAVRRFWPKAGYLLHRLKLRLVRTVIAY
ncbi:MAG TPA: S26 family signal peptidase [Thioploca sp.]|nr:S26 family signal peptidase [Thioploca sp.]